MAILAILDWTLVVTTQLQMNWDIFNNTKKPGQQNVLLN